MGVDRELLYGSTPGGAHRIIIPRGQPPEALPPIPFAARSIFVENPSGVWYIVNGFTVPPWTWGLVNRLDVPTASVAVARLTTPEVLISEDYGADLTIVAYEDALTPSLGRSLYPVPHDVLRANASLNAPEGSQTHWLDLGGAGFRLAPLTVQLGLAFGAATQGLVGGIVVAQWNYEVGGVTIPLTAQMVSPEAPTSRPVDVSGVGGAMLEGDDLGVTLRSELGAGLVVAHVVVEYFRALA